MDPDKQELDRHDAVSERHRLSQLEQVKQSIKPFAQAAQAGAFGISPAAGQSLLNAIRQSQDELNMAQRHEFVIKQDAKLGTSPDGVVMTKFNKEVAADGTNSGVAALDGLKEILEQAAAGVIEAMKHYRRADADNASGISRSGT